MTMSLPLGPRPRLMPKINRARVARLLVEIRRSPEATTGDLADRFGLSRAMVQAIRKDPPVDRLVKYPNRRRRPAKCPRCGALVHLPCLA